MKFGDLTKVPLYAGFVKSPQYREWLAYLKDKKPAARSAPAREGTRPAKETDAPGARKPGPNG